MVAPNFRTPCPPPGSGVHTWLLGAANRCRRQGLTEADACALLRQQMTRPPNPAREVEQTVRKAFNSNWKPSSASKPAPRVRYSENRLRRLVQDCPPVSNEELAALSPVSPVGVSWPAFLDLMFEPGEVVAVVPTWWRPDGKGGVKTLKAWKPFLHLVGLTPKVSDIEEIAGGSAAGSFYMVQPVTGESILVPNGKGGLRSSWWSGSCVTDWRHLVLESDDAPHDLWRRFLASVPLPIKAIYTSGGRSLHALCRIGATSKAEFDAFVQELKPLYKAVGGDPDVLSGVRLSRLPGTFRRQQKRDQFSAWQELLYLDPQLVNPTPLRKALFP
ncbi:MAG: hypothetical protein H7A46_25675 [Verrucomicrobiales bacterium]|nr:hypothetical protein [Verrucomicrobiales bacterium]